MKPTQDILNDWHLGRPVILTLRPSAGRDDGADGWRYAGLKRGPNGQPLLATEGRNTWRPLCDWLAAHDPASTMQAARAEVATLAWDLLRFTLEGGNAPEVAAYEWLRSVRCQGQRRTRRGTIVTCGDWLVRPYSVRAGFGPVCGGRYAEQQARSEAKRAIAASFVERMAERASGPVQAEPTRKAAPAERFEALFRAEPKASACPGPLTCTDWDCGC